MSNNFDTPILLDSGVGSIATPGDYLGFGRAAGGSVSTGPRVYAGTGSPNGTVTAPASSLWLRTDSVQFWQNTDGATAWQQLGAISSGGLSPTSIDTTATADFDWDVADNSATAVSWDAAGASGILGINSTNGGEHAFVSQGLRVLDNAALQFGTPGTDVVFTANGSDVVVTSAGDLVFADDVEVQWGTGKDVQTEYVSASNRLDLAQGLAVTAAGATAATAAVNVATGARTTTDAAVGNGSGALTFSTGLTDVTDAGGTGGASGAITVTTGAANSTAGASGASGAISLVTGNSADGASGNIVLTTGTAGTTRGTVDVNAATVDFVTQATDFEVIDNSAAALTISQGTRDFLSVVTTNAGEYLAAGAQSAGGDTPVVTNGADFFNRLVLVEDFAQRPLLNASIGVAANINFELAGTNAADANATFAAGGGISLATAAANNDQMIVRPHQDTNQTMWNAASLWNSDDSIIYKVLVRPITVASVRYVVGVKPDPSDLSDGGDADQMIVRFDTSGTTSAVNWVLITSNNGADTPVDTGVAVTTATNYRIVLAVAPTTRQVSCYINGVLVNTPASNVLRSIDLGEPMYGHQTRTTAAATGVLQKIGCSKVLD